MTDFTARPVEPYEYDTWDEFVASSPQGSLFHTSSWKRLVDLAYEPARLLLLGCFDSHSLLGGCVALDRSRCGQRTAVTPLLAPYVGYLLEVPPGEKLSDQVSRQEDIVSALASWMNQAFAYQNLINAPHLEDTRALQRSGYSLTPRFTYHINLKLPAEELWQRLDGSVRRQIRKAEKVEFVLCDMLDAPGAYSLFSGTFSRQGESCPVSRELFDAVAVGEHLRPCREVYCVYEGARLASFIVVLKFNGTLYYSLAATDPDLLNTGVASLLVWEVINRHACSEWSVFDFVGANMRSIARFKEGFNPQLKLHFQCERFGSQLLRIGKSVMESLRKQ